MAKKRDIKDAEEIRAYYADGNAGSLQLINEAILTMALRAHVELSPEVAAELYLAACGEANRFHNIDNNRMPSRFEVESILSLAHARLPILNELERWKRIKLYRLAEQKGGKQ